MLGGVIQTYQSINKFIKGQLFNSKHKTVQYPAVDTLSRKGRFYKELKVNKDIDTMEQLKCLIEDYSFNIETLSKYLELDNNQINLLAIGDISFLPSNNEYRFNLFNKIGCLYCSAVDDKDFKLDAFLRVVLSYHNISKKTISKMAGVDIKEIDKFLSLKKSKISVEDKYKLAITTMLLRFFLKDIEE